MEGFLICLIHSPGNSICDLLMKDVCIWLAASFDSAAPHLAPYTFTLFVPRRCFRNTSTACACRTEKRGAKIQEGKNEFKVVALLSHFFSTSIWSRA